MNFAIKLIISIIWDILDFTIFRIPALGTMTDIISIISITYNIGNAIDTQIQNVAGVLP